MDPVRIAFVCEGDAETNHAFSGIARWVVAHLRELGHEVRTFNASPRRIERLWVAARAFHPDRQVWRTRFRHGEHMFRVRSRRVRKAFARLPQGADVILQVGPSLEPPGGGRTPFTLFGDWNMALSIRFRDNPYSSTFRMNPVDASRINERHARIYRRAAAIFTMSDKLRDSFLQDYQIPAEKVVTVRAGPNLDLSRIPERAPAREPGHRPTVLFSGKEFRRKGGDLLLAAFGLVRQQLPDARLVILGPPKPEALGPGVEFRGFLNKDDPEQHRELVRLYAESDVFCLPTRLEPLGIVILEAMAFGLPCVTSDVWAMPEMVIDGENGFTVPVEDVPALTDRLLRLLRDPATAHRLGHAGRQRVQRLFTWEAAARGMHEGLQRVAQQGRP